MKIKVAFLVFMLCIATTASAFARGGYYGGHGGGYYRGGGHYDGYRSRSYYGGYGGRYRHGGHHYDDGLGIAVGVMGGFFSAPHWRIRQLPRLQQSSMELHIQSISRR